MMESARQFSGIEFVHVTPDPALAGLDGAHQRMLRAMKVFGGVLVLRGIAAAHIAAFKAQSQMHPGVAELDAIFADVHLGVLDFDLIEMCAGFGHNAPLCGQRSSDFRSQLPHTAAASYVLCRNSIKAALGESAVRTSPYNRRNSF